MNSVKAKFRITRILTRSPHITLSTILKNKEKFKHLFATSKLKPGIKRCRLATYQDVEEALFSWFKQARCMNVPISGPIMKIKAKELALKMGHSEFQCSTGWLERLSPELYVTGSGKRYTIAHIIKIELLAPRNRVSSQL